MDIMELGAIGELVGGVAVVASLIYVGLQVRQNTAQMRSQSDSATMMTIMEGFNPIYQNPEVFFKGTEQPADLTDRERQLYFLFLTRLMTCFQDQFLKSRDGTLSPEWTLLQRGFLARFFESPGVQGYWAETQHMYGSSFRALIGELLMSTPRQES